MAPHRFGKLFALALMGSLMSGAPVGAQAPGEGLIVKKSDFDTTKTLDRLGLALERAGITLFGRIKHASNAKKAGLELRPTEILIFGNPNLGTPLMQTNQAIGLDLPLRAVAWENADGTTYLAYTDPAALKSRYGIDDRDAVFEKMTGTLTKFTDMAVKKGALPSR